MGVGGAQQMRLLRPCPGAVSLGAFISVLAFGCLHSWESDRGATGTRAARLMVGCSDLTRGYVPCCRLMRSMLLGRSELLLGGEKWMRADMTRNEERCAKGQRS